MSELKLYIKNDKGRYEPYRPPEVEVDDKLYRKINGRYYPWEMNLRNEHLPEGVWVITRQKCCKNFANGKYLHEQFQLVKASDIKEVDLATLGGLEKIAGEVLESLPDEGRKMSTYELVHIIVGKVFEISKKKKE